MPACQVRSTSLNNARSALPTTAEAHNFSELVPGRLLQRRGDKLVRSQTEPIALRARTPCSYPCKYVFSRQVMEYTKGCTNSCRVRCDIAGLANVFSWTCTIFEVCGHPGHRRSACGSGSRATGHPKCALPVAGISQIASP